jgi:hypothetical protein
MTIGSEVLRISPACQDRLKGNEYRNTGSIWRDFGVGDVHVTLRSVLPGQPSEALNNGVEGLASQARIRTIGLI